MVKKVFKENQIDSLLFRISKGGIDTVKRIVFPNSQKRIKETLKEVSEYSRSPKTIVKPSFVTNDGTVYHLNDDNIIKEIKKSKEIVHGKGSIQLKNQDENGVIRELEKDEKIEISVEFPDEKEK